MQTKTQWTKTKDLQIGAKIAAADLSKNAMFWDEIVSIEKVGREKVWDIEVDGTRNFVGNQLIAHNTYINGTASASGALTLFGTPTIASTNMKTITIGDSNTGNMIINANLTVATTGNFLCINTTTKEIESGTTCTLSSERFKNSITPITSGLSTVLALEPVSFRFNQGYGDNGAAEQIGFVAEQAVKIDPRLVPLDKDGLPSGFNYANYTSILTKAIQELDTKIASLSAQFVPTSATVIPDINWQYATESGKLMAMSPVQVPELTVVGKLNVGLMTFDDLDASISSLTGTITIKGDLLITGSLKVLGASAGKAIIPSGQIQIQITNDNVATTSAIFVTPEEPVAIGAKASESGRFVITVPATLSGELKVNWWIVN